KERIHLSRFLSGLFLYSVGEKCPLDESCQVLMFVDLGVPALSVAILCWVSMP
ncbi:MAG: hypothetical protein ACI9OU_002074, partial [Candidatus Promineifilaceae bacterium]